MVMVSGSVMACLRQWLAAAEGQPLIQRLDPATRAKVLAALAGLIILGFAMVLLTWLGGRAARRYMNSRAPSGRRPRSTDSQEEDWASKPLAPGRQKPPGNRRP